MLACGYAWPLRTAYVRIFIESWGPCRPAANGWAWDGRSHPSSLSSLPPPSFSPIRMPSVPYVQQTVYRNKDGYITNVAVKRVSYLCPSVRSSVVMMDGQVITVIVFVCFGSIIVSPCFSGVP